MSNRQNWVDIAKGIAIIAVVVGHVSYSWPNSKLLPLSDLAVWLWHVPVFFMIGGFFLKEERLQQPANFIKGKLKSLYLPILYVYIPFLLLHNFFINIGFYDTGIEYYGKYVALWGIADFGKHLLAAIFFAGREPLLGAMWFVYVLFMTLTIICIGSWGLRKIGKNWDAKTYEFVRCLSFLLLAVFSCTATQVLDFTIPRFNNTLVAVWLIYVGMVLVQKTHIRFDNGIVALTCTLIGWHSAVCRGGG